MRVTGSRLALLHECAYWARDGVEWQESTSDAASFGTQLHVLFEAAVEGRTATCDDPAVLAVFERHVEPWVQAYRRAGWRAEVPFAINLDEGTARELPKTTHRGYDGKRPDELCLTTDLVYMSEDAEGPFGCVDDLKWSGFHGDAEKARAQLTGQALAVARAWSVDRVRARALRVSEDGLDDTTEVDWCDVFDLAEIEASIAADVARIEGSEPRPGGWCTDRWCPARLSCKVTTEALQAPIPVEALSRFRPELMPMSPEHAAWMWPRLELAEAWISTAKANIKDLARHAPIDLGDGTELRETTQTRSSASVQRLTDLAQRLGATPEQVAGCRTGATFSQVRAMKRREVKP
jgi:hypothetical protein